MLVYVLDINNCPLMPTKRCGKVRRMLRGKQAKVVRREPFTIKLLYEPKTNVVQPVTLGVDTGSDKVGTSAIANDTNKKLKREILNKINSKKEKTKIGVFSPLASLSNQTPWDLIDITQVEIAKSSMVIKVHKVNNKP